jgi:hypothetical protein
MAPMMPPMKPAGRTLPSAPVGVLNTRWLSQPPRNMPATPSIAVMMKPPGSFPGIRNFAMMPTTRPTMNIHNQPMESSFREWMVPGHCTGLG